MVIYNQKEGKRIMLFQIGSVVTTNGVYEKCESDAKFHEFVRKSFSRHINGDWGDLCDEDKEMNNLAVKNGDDRILSRYDYDEDHVIYIITEWDRSVTTILFTYEY